MKPLAVLTLLGAAVVAVAASPEGARGADAAPTPTPAATAGVSGPTASAAATVPTPTPTPRLVQSGDETRRATVIVPGRPLEYRVPRDGRVSLGIAPPPPKMGRAPRLTASGLRVSRVHNDGAVREVLLEVAAPSADAWQPVDLPRPLRSGDLLLLESTADDGSGAGVVAAAPRTRPEAALPGRAEGPLAILIMLDTVRADRMSLYGYDLPTTPNLEVLARDAVVFEDALSPTNWTRPAVASLLTGLDPDGHQVVKANGRLAERVDTIAEIALRQEFRSVAVSTNPNVLPVWGLAQGFDRFVDLETADWLANADGRDVTRRARAILADEASPLLLYLHFNDAHNPYDPPLDDARALYPDYAPEEPGMNPLPGADAATLRGSMRRYDGEVRRLDAALGEFFAHLRSAGLYDGALIVVVADHGEEFGEHGGIYHGRTLHQEMLHVPLVVKLPGGRFAGKRVGGVVSTVDVLPTIAEVMGWPLPSGLDGRSLIPLVDGSGSPRGKVFAFHTTRGRKDDREGRALAVVASDVKLIRDVVPERDQRVYDLAIDPGEKTPRRDDPRAAELARALDVRVTRRGRNARTKPMERVEADPSVVERLRALGYVDEPSR